MRKLIIDPNIKEKKISRNIYGHFSEHLGRCIYEGMFVGEESSIPNVKGMRTDVVEALREIKVPVLRWPGGCFADEYHWMDGIGPKEQRKKMINTHWGGVVEDNSFGTHEFLELCSQIGCDPFISGNVGSGTVREMSEWVEYMTFAGVSPMADLRKSHGREEPWKVPYFGVGNENWGCGGNMCAEYYARTYRHYQTYVREYGDNKIAKIACGPNVDDYHWTKVMMELCHSRTAHRNGGNYRMDGLSLHYYTVPGGWEDRGSAVVFNEEKYFHTLKAALRMDELVREHSRIMDEYDPEKSVGLVVDEWGTWYDVAEGTNPGFLYQQNTMRDALVAGLTLNIFNKHCDRVKMANLAQTVNVLQAVILTQGDKMIKTPTYHVFDLYKGHQDARLLESCIEAQDISSGEFTIPDLHVSASQDDTGAIRATLVCLSPSSAQDIVVQLKNERVKSASARILTGKIDAFNDFDALDRVKPQVFDKITITGGELQFQVPPCAVMEIIVEIE
jgi:alpha-N-arabinofuranosidase